MQLYVTHYFKLPHQTKTSKMDPHLITRQAKKLLSYPPSENLFNSLIPPNTPQEKPSQYVAALAHEVRNPLSNINLAVEMMKSSSIDEDQKIYLDIILRGSGRINDLITDLLLSFEEKEMKVEKHSICQLIEEVLLATKDRIMLKSISVRKDFTTLDCKILVNKQKMKIALTNIIINAIDAMPSENGKLRLVTKSINGKCIIEIEDNGIGISKENLKKIFKPYFTNKLGGMGLGLSTTLDILVSNHARVDVQSEEGKGTRFILSFDGIQQSEDLFL
jgi:signal transduction histidine kinase